VQTVLILRSARHSGGRHWSASCMRRDTLPAITSCPTLLERRPLDLLVDCVSTIRPPHLGAVCDPPQSPAQILIVLDYVVLHHGSDLSVRDDGCHLAGLPESPSSESFGWTGTQNHRIGVIFLSVLQRVRVRGAVQERLSTG